MNVVRPLPFVLAASDLGPMIVSRLDYSQNPHGFYGVGFQILHTGSYDATEIETVLGLLDSLHLRRSGGVVALDCGANVGVHTLAMARHMLSWGSVHAFEAQERLYYALCGNIALGNFFNVRAHNCAVSDRPGTLQIPQPDYNRAGSLGSLELQRRPETEFIGQSVSYAARDLVPVRAVSIDELAFPRVDFVKIDVEGMECAVLRGAHETLERDHPTLLIEWIKSGAAEIRDILAPLGYGFREAGGNLIAEASNV
jgi:FkbM family methyltransferase